MSYTWEAWEDQRREAIELAARRQVEWKEAKAAALANRPALPDELPKCALGIKIITRSCGHNQAIVLRCGLPVCTECERIRAEEERERWAQVIERMHSPTHWVFALRSDVSLAKAGGLLDKCFNRFLELRLGRASRKKYLVASLALLAEWRERFDRKHNENQSFPSSARIEKSIRRFWLSDVPTAEAH